MAEFEGQVKRDLNKRKFNRIFKQFCGTGGVEIGCPFFRLNNARKWVCTLFRLIPKPEGKRYKRVDACLNDEDPPIKKSYIVHCTQEHNHSIIAISENEVRKLFARNCGGSIIEIIEGAVIDYENII